MFQRWQACLAFFGGLFNSHSRCLRCFAAFLQQHGTVGELYLTQWSSVLPSTTASTDMIAKTRRIAAMAEKGDPATWNELAGHVVTMWQPEDPSQAARLVKAFLAISDPRLRPRGVRLIAPIPLVAGAKTVAQVLDLWSSPLLLGRWSAVVRNCTISTTPMSFVLPSRAGPKHVQMGLAVFHLSHDLPRVAPSLLEPMQPMMSIASPCVVVVDTPAEHLAQLFGVLERPIFNGVQIREPSHSPLSIQGLNRVALRLVFPPGSVELVVLAHLSSIRGTGIGADTYYGIQDMAGSSDAKILEIGNSVKFRSYWAVCSQALAIAPRKFLVQSQAEPAEWTQLMDGILGRDADDATAKLRWKPSVRGGRVIATPTATTAALAAARRGANRPVTSADCLAVVEVQGELGPENAAVLHHLMEQTAQNTGLAISRAADAQAPALGEYFVDADRPGHVRILLPDFDSVRRVYAALNGRTLAVGVDRVAIRVMNDAVDGQAVLGGHLRRH